MSFHCFMIVITINEIGIERSEFNVDDSRQSRCETF